MQDKWLNSEKNRLALKKYASKYVRSEHFVHFHLFFNISVARVFESSEKFQYFNIKLIKAKNNYHLIALTCTSIRIQLYKGQQS